MAEVAISAAWGLHSLGYKEATAAGAQQKADSSRNVQQHKVGSTKPDVTMHDGMHRCAMGLRSKWRLNSGVESKKAALQPQVIWQRSESCDGDWWKMRSLQDDVHQRLQQAACGRLQSACRRRAEKNTDCLRMLNMAHPQITRQKRWGQRQTNSRSTPCPRVLVSMMP